VASVQAASPQPFQSSRTFVPSVAFPCTNNEQSKKEIKTTIPFTIASKIKIPWKKFNEGCKTPMQQKLQITEERNQ
jgi:hypothetical protein